MYDLIEKPVQTLPNRDRFLLIAMRQWVFARIFAGRPADAVKQRFEMLNLSGCLPSFEATMEALNKQTKEPLVFNRPCHGKVSDGEAIVLSIWHAVFSRRNQHATKTLALLVTPAEAPTIAGEMALVCREIRKVWELSGPC